MKKLILLILILVSNPTYSQVSNQDIMNRLDEIEDQKLFNHYLNEIQRPLSSNKGYSFRSDTDLKLITSTPTHEFYISKSSIKKLGPKLITFTLFGNRLKPKYFGNKISFSFGSGNILDCSIPKLSLFKEVHYSGENETGEIVYESDKILSTNTEQMRTDPLYSKIKSYLCP